MLHKNGFGGDYFYCYSRRCALFIRSMGIPYIEIGAHPITGSIYSKFNKSDKLNEILKLWDSIKYKFDKDDGDENDE